MAGTDCQRWRAGGLLGPLAAGFADWLAAQGFAQDTVDAYLRWLGWLSGWLEARGLDGHAVTGAVADEFAAAMRAAGHPKVTSGRVARMMSYLRSVKAVPEARPAPLTGRQRMLAEFRCYLEAGRGLAPGTVTERLRVAGLFLDGLGCGDGPVPEPDVRQVLGIVRSWGSLARRRCSPLRSFLRFMHMTGYAGQDVAVALPATRKASGTRRAARLTPAEAGAVLAASGPGEQGLRERAVLLLAGRLGLRASEVSWLTLDDIAWRTGIISFRRKGGRRGELPLTADAGQALADYLSARPPVPGTRAVFVTVIAPRRQLARTGVAAIVRTATARAGKEAGPHQFRHLLGGELLEAGIPLAGIAQVLGHRDLAVTSSYLEPGQSRLAALARPWPAAGRQ
jgi:integrase/recombinase XerD